MAVVGARKCSAYGREVAHELALGLARAGVVVASGLALGIDAAAHEGALAGGGDTIAVMGTGPDRVYPVANRQLAERIAAQGALVTQFPPGSEPHRGNFPTRNAVISGMSLAVVVVEARVRSGAMLTAGSGGSQGRQVMAVPGDVHSSLSEGCHDLIRDGAQLVTCAGDVLEAIRQEPMRHVLAQPAQPAAPPAPRFGDLRDEVVEQLAGRSLTADELTLRLGAPAADVSVACARLRVDGWIGLDLGRYRLNRNPC